MSLGYREYVASDGSRWHLRCVCPPVPSRAHDWEWVADDFGGPGDDRWGTSPTEEEARADVEEHVAEEADQRRERGWTS